MIGLYGIGGLGKTTLCNSLCNHYYAEYAGKVSIVEFSAHDQKHIDLEIYTSRSESIDKSK